MRVGQLNVVSRERAGLRAPKNPPTRIRRPAPRSWVHHTGGDADVEVTKREVHRRPKWSERTFLRAMCRYWREVQAFHQNTRGWNDVAYSYGIAPGIFGLRPRVLVGRGAGVQGAHTEGDNDGSLGIVIFGDFTDRKLNRMRRRKIRQLLDELVATGELEGPRRKHPTGGHTNAPNAATACPTPNVLKHIGELRRPVRRDQ